MPRSFSPLRYPGGKTSLLELMSSIIRLNGLEQRAYVEPYAGGCGLALGLLMGGHVSEIHVNDLDPSIWAFWHSVLFRTEDLVEMVEGADLSVPEWRRQRDIYLAQDIENPLDLGFATFFLNRTNRSGIIKGAGLIGGLSQSGNYKMDCRFNRSDLSGRIRRIAKYRRRIHLYRLDALEFLQEANVIVPKTALFCIDPPYYNKGSSLYTSFYNPEDHSDLANEVLRLDRPWVVTYDDTPEIRSLYSARRRYSFDINYSVQTKRVGTELLVAGPHLLMPTAIELREVA